VCYFVVRYAVFLPDYYRSSAIHVKNEWFGDLILFLLGSESSNAGAKHQACSQTDHSKQLWQESEAPITIP
jgi:hypothetical protein